MAWNVLGRLQGRLDVLVHAVGVVLRAVLWREALLFGLTIARPSVVAAVLLGCASWAAGAPLRVAITSVGDGCAAATIAVTPVCPTGECAQPYVAQWNRGDDALQVDTTAAEEWTIEAESDSCWAPALHVRRDAGQSRIVLPLWRTADLRGRLIPPKGSASPASLSLQIESPPPSNAPDVPRTALLCPVSNDHFRCAVPAAALDVRFGADGFVPRYFWGVNPDESGTIDLGDVPLTSGGSVAGAVRFNGDAPSPAGVALELRPALPPVMDRGWTAEEKRLAALAVVARPNERGFFQFTSVEPGQYTLTARHDGWSTTRRGDIAVSDAGETLVQPIVIEPLTRIEVLIQPPVDPYGKPWKLSLQDMTPLSSLTVPIAKGDAALNGSWSADSVDSGFKKIDVRDHGGSSFAYSIVEVSPRMAPVLITIASVAVRGTIAIGEEPLRTRLEFRNGKGTMVAMKSDQEGRFAGALPGGGKWDVMVADARLGLWLKRSIAIPRDRAVAEIDLELPETRLAGKIVSGDGTPAAANLRLYDADRKYIAGAAAGEDGVFRFVGIEPGPVYLLAENRETRATSGLVPLDVEDGATEDVTVVLRPRVTFRGRLTTPSGAPVAGAIVRWLMPGRNVYAEEVSGPDGFFEIAVSVDVREIDMIILPPALPARLLSVSLGSELSPRADVVLGAPAGTLQVEMEHEPPFPSIGREGKMFPIRALTYPFNWSTPPRELRPWGMTIELEAGEYTICGEASGKCVRKLIAPGAIERVDGRILVE